MKLPLSGDYSLVTVTVVLALYAPLVAVMIAVPTALPVTVPFTTLATAGLDDTQTTGAVLGVTVAVMVALSPTSTLAVVGDTLSAVAAFFAICPMVSGV